MTGDEARRNAEQGAISARARGDHAAERRALDSLICCTNDRERLGQLVRDTWTRWAAEQPDVDQHPSWLVPWNRLAARDREVDMLIGEAVAEVVRAETAERIARLIEETGRDAHIPYRGAARIARETR